MHSALLESSVGQGMGQDWVLRQPGHGYSQMWCSVIPIPCVHTLQRAVLRFCGGEKQLSGTKRHGENWQAQGGGGVFSGVHSTAVASLVRQLLQDLSLGYAHHQGER